MIPVKPGAGHFIQINRTNTSPDMRGTPCVSHYSGFGAGHIIQIFRTNTSPVLI